MLLAALERRLAAMIIHSDSRILARRQRSQTGSETACCKCVHVLLVDADPGSAGPIVKHFTNDSIEVVVCDSLSEARTFLRDAAVSVDVVILELLLPDGRGESLLADIDACIRQPAVIIASAYVADLQAGAIEYRPVVVSKPISPAALLRIVRTVVGGYTRPILKRFVTSFALSRREAQAVTLVATGLRPKEIADRMQCREPTVYGHLSRACQKTRCADYHEIIARLFSYACQAGGHTPPDHQAIGD